MFNANNPAPGVKVYGVPMPNVVVSASVRLAMRTPLKNHRGETVGVFRPHMSGGPQTIGMISTVRSLPPMVLPVKGRDQTIKDRSPGKRRSPKMRPQNPIFQKQIPSQSQYRQRAAEKEMRNLRKLNWAIMGRGYRPDMQDRFDRQWHNFQCLYPEYVEQMRKLFHNQASSIRH